MIAFVCQTKGAEKLSRKAAENQYKTWSPVYKQGDDDASKTLTRKLNDYGGSRQQLLARTSYGS